MALKEILWVFFLGVLVNCEPNDQIAISATVLKCCRYGEELTKPENGTDGTFRCVPSSVQWKPLIYSPMAKGLLGNIPDSWTVLDDQRPHCEKSDHVVTLIPNTSMKPFILLDTGHAILQPVGTGERFEPGEYCADAQGLLVCAPGKIEANRAAATMRPKVHRCCGKGAAYHEDG